MLEGSSNSYTKIPVKDNKHSFESKKSFSQLRLQPLEIINPVERKTHFDSKYIRWMVIISVFAFINTIFLWAIFQYT